MAAAASEIYGISPLSDHSAAPSAGAELAQLLDRFQAMGRATGAGADLLGRVDHVTLLPNRVQFISDIEKVIADGVGGATAAKVLILVTLAEAMHFNEILRAVGHAYSEDFVRAGARRLHAALGPGPEMYHVSVLSFAFVVEDRDGSESERFAKLVVEAFAEPLSCQNIPIDTKVGIGMTHLDQAKRPPAELLRKSLAAAQDSRSAAEGWSWYDPKTDRAHVRGFRLLSDLKSALQCDDQLFLNFQPRVDMATRRCVGAEALLRWHHPEFGLISPGEFIPLAETSALITLLTRWVISRTLRHAARWRRDGDATKISMNVSPKNVLEPDFVEFVLAQCRENRIDPGAIELEFTEGTLAAKGPRTVERLGELHDAGIDLAIDDFGSGYSNMSYLALLPAQTLKIDQAFVRPLDHRPRNATLLRSIIELGHNLGYRVVAEGIETQSSFDSLASWGCDEGQGFRISKPLTEQEFLNWAGRNARGCTF